MITDVNKIAEAIDIPKEKWEGNCHTISYQILKKGLVKGHLERGHYYGEIDSSSIFANKGIIVPHSWIRLEDGTIYDPTRFAFEGVSPYIYTSYDTSIDEKEYDIGGCRLRSNRPVPVFDKNKPSLGLKFKTKECEEFIFSLVNYPPYLSINEVFFLANFPMTGLGEHGMEFYTILEENGHGAFIPLDSYEYVMKTHHVR